MTVSSAILLDHTADRAPALMAVAGLCKRYGEQRALADISFAVNAGEVLGLIGPNGAGKTTIMEAIAGVHGKGNVDERALFAIALAQAGHLHQRGDAVGSTVKEDGARHRHART